ncbi:hypothetical protein SUGI_0801620 [Cryptomeria japonica]|nr:hypothetical protein SUGI_0801620 [Cryptomeria japonica]
MISRGNRVDRKLTFSSYFHSYSEYLHSYFYLILQIMEPQIGACVWTTLLLFVFAIFSSCTIINTFKRLAGEVFGMLIVVLFLQEAIKVMVEEFCILENEDELDHLDMTQVFSKCWDYSCSCKLQGLLSCIINLGFSMDGNNYKEVAIIEVDVFGEVDVND